MIRKTVIITGGSGGIGKETALKFAQNGYNVGLTYNSNDTKDIEEKIKACGVDYLSLHMNLLDEKEIKDAFSKFFGYFKTIDVVVCNAGIAESEKMLIDRSFDDISRVLDVNLKGTILTNREAINYFIKEKHGVLINISSILGVVGSSCEVVYSASKAGIIGLTKALAKEVGEYNIRVNAVAPGMIETNMTKNFTKEEKDVLKEKTLVSRLGRGEDVAGVVYFLASDEASFITGECINVTGGLLIWI